MTFSSFWFSGSAGADPVGVVGNSLRFRGAQRLVGPDPLPTGDYTISLWVKRGDQLSSTDTQALICTDNNTGYWLNNNRAQDPYTFVRRTDTGGTSLIPYGPAVYRDYSAWYNFVIKKDGSDTVVFVNGDQQPVTQSAPLAPNNLVFGNNNDSVVDNPFEGYLADIYVIDGQALDADSFGAYNDNGVWIPIKYNGAYGTNGFHLNFSDPSNVGEDSSGNGNNFTAVGFELTDTTSPDYDFMTDSPTRNFCTFNELDKGNSTSTSNANLTGSIDNSTFADVACTICTAKSGKYYFEGYLNASDNTSLIGFTRASNYASNHSKVDSYRVVYQDTGNIFVEGTGLDNVTGIDGYAPGDLIGVAIDAEAGQITFFKNNSQVGQVTSATAIGDVDWKPYGGVRSNTWDINFGQRPFEYTPPDDFLALQTQNLPAPPVKTGTDGFRALTGPGADIKAIAQAAEDATGGTNWNSTITTGFTSGFWLIKDLANSNQWQFVDSVRGDDIALRCPNSNPEVTYGAPSGNSVAYCWKTPGNPVTNTEGTITGTVEANTETGFSIVGYTGNKQNNATIGHGLNQAPDAVWIACRNTTYTPSNLWRVYLTSVMPTTSNGKMLSLQSPNAMFSSGQPRVSAVSDTLVTLVGGNNDGSNYVNGPGNYIMYCWTAIPGYSAFGTWTGNGSSSNGPFIYTGFRPAFVLIKRSSGGDGNWVIIDSTTSPYNGSNSLLYINANSAAATSAVVDFNSNGFKLRTGGGAYNKSGSNYAYMAFAESPFGGSDVSPADAR